MLLALSGLFVWQVQKHEETIALMEEQLFKAQRPSIKVNWSSRGWKARFSKQMPLWRRAERTGSGNQTHGHRDAFSRKQLESLSGQVKTQSTTQNSAVDKLTQQLHPLEEQVKSLNDLVAAVDSQSKSLTLQVDEQSAQLEALGPGLEGVKADVVACRPRLARSRERLSRCRLRCADLARMAELETAVGKLTRERADQVSANQSRNCPSGLRRLMQPDPNWFSAL